MRKAGALAAVVAAVIAGLLLYRQRDSRSKPPTTAPATAKPAVAVATDRGDAPALAPERGEPPPIAHPEPDRPSDPERDAQVARIHRELITAATPCYRNRKHRPPPTDPGAPDETMQELRVAFQVVIVAGQATLAQIERADPAMPGETLNTPIQDEDLADCIIDALTVVTLPTSDADETYRIVDTIIVGELDRPAPVAPSPKPTAPPSPR